MTNRQKEQRLSATTADIHSEGKRLDDHSEDFGDKVLRLLDKLFKK